MPELCQLLRHLAKHRLHALDVLLGDDEEHAEAAVERRGQLPAGHLFRFTRRCALVALEVVAI